jgi:hypothetical protein
MADKKVSSMREDFRSIFQGLFGSDVAKQVDGFDNPERYPNEFVEECTDFLGKLIGRDAAVKKLETLYKKYGMKPIQLSS